MSEYSSDYVCVPYKASLWWISVVILQFLIVTLGCFSHCVFIHLAVLPHRFGTYTRITFGFISLMMLVMLLTSTGAFIMALAHGKLIEDCEISSMESRKYLLYIHSFGEYFFVVCELLGTIERVTTTYSHKFRKSSSFPTLFTSGCLLGTAASFAYIYFVRIAFDRTLFAIGFGSLTAMEVLNGVSVFILYYVAKNKYQTKKEASLNVRYEFSQSYAYSRCAVASVIARVIILTYVYTKLAGWFEGDLDSPFYYIMNVFINFYCLTYPWAIMLCHRKIYSQIKKYLGDRYSLFRQKKVQQRGDKTLYTIDGKEMNGMTTDDHFEQLNHKEFVSKHVEKKTNRMKKINWDTTRAAVAFFLLGLCNNYGYVIMLSAAEDILSQQHGKNKTTTVDACLPSITVRECKPPTAEVLLSDNLPSLIVKLTFPFFMDRFPFGLRVAVVCLLQATSYFVVAFSVSIPMSLAGVVFVSLGGGLGEITFLGLSAHYQRIAIAGWSSGTGMAGLLGSFSYAFLTEPHMANLTPKTALLIQLFIPVVFAISYFILLEKPESIYSPSVHPKTWIVPKGYDDFIVSKHRVPQRQLGPWERVQLIIPMLHLMIPLAFVYVGEYMINQGMTQQIVFDCSHGFQLSLHSQYRWYQVLYQLGVFLSRSSIKLIELPMWVLYLLPILQLSNMVFFFFDALYWFVPHIAIIFALIIFEGLFGGSSYVNTFHKIHNKVEPDVREYCLSAASMGDSLGVNFAAGVSIPLHYWMCGRPSPR
ncbi:unnamed protein product [Caenorhabditis sp. 36 PRJEB53466]|nr:unnamed protein product [Caenorhabditis sp. 36 PRJEB53466]